MARNHWLLLMPASTPNACSARTPSPATSPTPDIIPVNKLCAYFSPVVSWSEVPRISWAACWLADRNLSSGTRPPVLGSLRPGRPPSRAAADGSVYPVAGPLGDTEPYTRFISSGVISLVQSKPISRPAPSWPSGLTCVQSKPISPMSHRSCKSLRTLGVRRPRAFWARFQSSTS